MGCIRNTDCHYFKIATVVHLHNITQCHERDLRASSEEATPCAKHSTTTHLSLSVASGSKASSFSTSSDISAQKRIMLFRHKMLDLQKYHAP